MTGFTLPLCSDVIGCGIVVGLILAGGVAVLVAWSLKRMDRDSD